MTERPVSVEALAVHEADQAFGVIEDLTLDDRFDIVDRFLATAVQTIDDVMRTPRRLVTMEELFTIRVLIGAAGVAATSISAATGVERVDPEQSKARDVYDVVLAANLRVQEWYALNREAGN